MTVTPDSPSPLPERPSVSVVIPTRNRAQLLGLCLESLVSQTYPDHLFEVVVVDNGSTDDTATVVEQWSERGGGPRVRRLFHPQKGVNQARNRGIVESRGELVFLHDDDETSPANLVEMLVTALEEDPEAAAVGGRYVSNVLGPVPYLCERCRARQWSQGSPQVDPSQGRQEVTDLPGGLLMVRRSVLDSVGLFAPELSGAGDDTEWCSRAREGGHRLVAEPEAFVWHNRLREQLGLRLLVPMYFKAGRDRAILSPRLRPELRQSWREAPAHLARSLAHTVRHRCRMGIPQSANALGTLVGSLIVALRRRGKTVAQPAEVAQ